MMHNFLAAGKQIPANYLLSSGTPERIWCCSTDASAPFSQMRYVPHCL